MIGVHPKIVGIAPELILRAIETVELAEVLGGKEADGRGRDVVTRDEKIHLMAVLADESPANETGAHQSSRTIDRLDLTKRSGLVGDEISFVGSDRESAASVENDIDNVGAGSA